MPCGRSAEPYERRRWIAQPIAARGRPCWSRRSPPKAALDSRLMVSYALGSLAHGGFSPLVSDVDLGLILADPLRTIDRIAIRQMTHSLRSAGPTMCERLSVVRERTVNLVGSEPRWQVSPTRPAGPARPWPTAHWRGRPFRRSPPGTGRTASRRRRVHARPTERGRRLPERLWEGARLRSRSDVTDDIRTHRRPRAGRQLPPMAGPPVALSHCSSSRPNAGLPRNTFACRLGFAR
jgi:hypothetical protein